MVQSRLPVAAHPVACGSVLHGESLEEGEYDSPKSVRSTFESCYLNSSAGMPRFNGRTAFDGTLGGSGSPFCCVIGTVSSSSYFS